MGITEAINFSLSYFNGSYFLMAIKNPLSRYNINGFFMVIIWNINLISLFELFDDHYFIIVFDGHYYNHFDNANGLFDGHWNILMVN